MPGLVKSGPGGGADHGFVPKRRMLDTTCGCRGRLAGFLPQYVRVRIFSDATCRKFVWFESMADSTLNQVLEYRVTTMAERKRKRTGDVNVQSLLRKLDDGLRQVGAIAEIKEMRPREFVGLMTSSSFEIGRIFKRGLRDALYDQRREASRKRSRARRGTDT